MSSNATTPDVLATIRARIPDVPKADMSRTERDRATLLCALEDVLGLADYLDGLADGDRHYATLIRRVVKDALGGAE